MKTQYLIHTITLFLISFTAAFAQSELFLRIADNGRYTVQLEDQSITVTNGRFRFFDLPAGRARLTIALNNRQVFQQIVDFRNNSRIVAEFEPRAGFRIINTVPLTANTSAAYDWDSNFRRGPFREGPYAGGRGGSGQYEDGRDAYGRAPLGIAPQELERIRLTMSRKSFDEEKFEFLRNVLPDRPVTATQMAELLRQFSFDRYRLEAAKTGWEIVTDRQNYYVVFDTFSSNSSVRDLKRHIGWR
ncbi:hypothetical protein GCM10023189_44350 [Nibrella saemangeumensis]|uniref:DUF4476 domain-containing protein n=1 Tax=Nibrella saemangeumensis TaxID=1084526 RepID=A0ABP8NET9_9BACT